MKRRVTWVAAAALLLLATPASADDDALKKEAEQRFQEGKALLEAGKYEPAHAKLVQAFAVSKLPNVLFNLAQSERYTARYVDASRHYREYLRVSKKVTPEGRAEIDGWLKEIGQFIGRLDIVAPPGAHLLVDGQGIGDAPLADVVDVDKGTHTVVADTSGKTLRAQVEAPLGATTRVVLSDAAPSDAVSPPPHEPEPSSTMRYAVPGGIAALGLVGLGVGLGFTLHSNAQVDDAVAFKRSVAGGACEVRTSETCVKYGAMLDDVKSSRDLATGLYVVGGVLLAGAVATFALWPAPKSSRAWVRPAILNGGLGAVGEF